MRTFAVGTLDAAVGQQAFAFHRGALRLALAGTAVFAWVFIFGSYYQHSGILTFAVAQTALLYALTSVVIALATPLGARSIERGSRRTIGLALLFCLLSLLVLASALSDTTPLSVLPFSFVLFAVAFGAYRACYWVPYHAEQKMYEGMGRSLGADLLVIFAPLVAGLFIASDPSGQTALLLIGAACVLVSLLFVPHLQQVQERSSWSYRQTYRQLMRKENRPLAARAFGEGVAGGALLFFWPIAVFLITGWSYGMLGIVLTLTFIAAVFVRGYVRSFLAKLTPRNSKLLSATLAVTPWLFRLAVATPLGAVLVDTYFYTTTPQRLGIDPFVVEQSSDGGRFVDEFTALKEIALALGRAMVCIFGAFAVLYTSVPLGFLAVFLAAAVASGLVALNS